MIADHKSLQACDSPKESKALANQSEAYAKDCSGRLVSHGQVLVDNLPYIVMIILGAAIFWLGIAGNFWRWFWAGIYIAYGVGGAFWIIIFVCPYCHFYGTRLCPCGYGIVSARLRAKKANSTFARQFKKHIPAIVPLWFIPLIAGVIFLFMSFSWTLLGLLLAFAVNSYVILPFVSRQHGCASCAQKDTCPWMGCGK